MTPEDLSTEAEWIRRCQRGEKEAFGYLVKRYMKQAYYVALSILGSHEEALDASQEAFVKAYRAIGSFDTEKKFYTWYYRILKNHCLNMIRKKGIDTVALSKVVAAGIESAGESDDDRMEREQLRRAVWDALWKLDPEDRELIVARDMFGTPYTTLAELMECPLGTVMSRLYYARRKLRERISQEVG